MLQIGMLFFSNQNIVWTGAKNYTICNLLNEYFLCDNLKNDWNPGNFILSRLKLGKTELLFKYHSHLINKWIQLPLGLYVSKDREKNLVRKSV